MKDKCRKVCGWLVRDRIAAVVGYCLLVMGADGGTVRERLAVCLGIVTAVAILGCFLYLAEQLERLLKRNGIQILSKITGLMLAALAAQIIFTGIKNFLR